MAQRDTIPRFPPPRFPPPRRRLFSTTPPAIFPPLLGLIGLGLALRQASAWAGLGQGLAELALGLVMGLWGLAVVAIKVKVWTRLPVLVEDLRPLPGRAGMAAAALGGMAMGAVLAPYAPGVAVVLLLGALVAHLVLAVLTLRVMAAQGDWAPNPTWHLSFTGLLVAAAPLQGLGWTLLAQALTGLGLVSALCVWALSARQLLRFRPPAPLRPLLVLHLAPAALLSLAFGALDLPALQLAFGALALGIGVTLGASLPWILAAGPSPLWGALTFPLAALAQALWPLEPFAALPLTLAALGLIPWIAWTVLKTWPGGRLAQRSHAAEA